jgi:hypothetical protein
LKIGETIKMVEKIGEKKPFIYGQVTLNSFTVDWIGKHSTVSGYQLTLWAIGGGSLPIVRDGESAKALEGDDVNARRVRPLEMQLTMTKRRKNVRNVRIHIFIQLKDRPGF